MDELLFGIRTTVVGMGVVFGMLLLLWGLLSLVGRLDRDRDTDPVATAADDGEAAAVRPATGAARAPSPVVRVDGTEALDPSLVAAITVAVIRHAEARRLQAAPSMRAYWPGSLLFASRWVSAGRTRQGQSWRPRSR